jgi:hypothetical protein
MPSDLACNWAVSNEDQHIRTEVADTNPDGFAGPGHCCPIHDPPTHSRRVVGRGAFVDGTPTADPDGTHSGRAIPSSIGSRPGISCRAAPAARAARCRIRRAPPALLYPRIPRRSAAGSIEGFPDPPRCPSSLVEPLVEDTPRAPRPLADSARLQCGTRIRGE